MKHCLQWHLSVCLKHVAKHDVLGDSGNEWKQNTDVTERKKQEKCVRIRIYLSSADHPGALGSEPLC